MNVSKKYVYVMGALIVLLLSLVIVQGKSTTNYWTGDLPYKKCSPVNCGTVELKNGEQTVYCPEGQIPLSCGYHIADMYGNDRNIIMQEVHPFYNEITDGFSGCELKWKVPSNNNKADVRVEAYCVPWI